MKSLFSFFDPIQWVGFIISGLVTYYLLVKEYDDLLSILVGLVLVALTQGVDLQKRLKDSEEQLLKATTYQDLYLDKELRNRIQQIVRDYQSVKTIWFDLFQDWADEAIDQCSNVLHGMAEGEWIDPIGRTGAQKENTLRTILEGDGTLKAVAAIDAPYWRSREADNWVGENANAIGRDVEVTRIFVYPEETLRDIVDVMDQQQNMGIHVYVAPTEKVPPYLISDFIIFDDRVVHTIEGAGQQNRISIVNVRQKIAQFNDLLRFADELDDWKNSNN